MFPIVVLLLGVSGLAGQAQTADWLIENATIYTANPKQPKATSIAIQGNRILAVGDGLGRFAGPNTKRTDLKKAVLIPGLIDSHVHLRGLGGLLESTDLRDVKSIAEVAALVKQDAARRPKGEWVVMRNWDQTNWGGQFPVAADLDRVVADRPVYLTRVDGHAGWVNSAALKLAGIDRKREDPPGGKIIRDAKGDPTGVLIDRAQGLVRAQIPPVTEEQTRRQLKLAAKECARLGMTTVHDAGVPKQDLDAYRALLKEGNFPLRVYAMVGGAGPLWQEYLKRGPEIGDQLTVRCIKLVADGALGSRGAALWQPYSDDKDNTGLLITSREDIERISREAAERGFQVATHAIGDRANRVVLDAYSSVLGGKNDKRYRVEHSQIISLPDFVKFRDNSIIASMQATHATSDMRWALTRLGPDRIPGAYAWRRLLDMGVTVANGSDFPVEQPNPMLGFYSSVTRQDLKGMPDGGWTPDQKMTREEALHSWTMAGAYAAFEENTKGSLEAGKLADFIVLDRDIMTVPALQIPSTRVRTTVLGGRIVFER